MSRATVVARHLAPVALATGILALGYAGYVVVTARTFQAREQQRFEMARHEPIARVVPVEGGAIGRLHVPRLGLAVMVAQGDSAATLRRAVGHVADTALPGEVGNVVLAGHRDTFFRALEDIRVDDNIAMDTHEGTFWYRVESTSVVPPSDLGVLQPTGGRTLTLITCFPFRYVGPAPTRFIVRARAVTCGDRASDTPCVAQD